MENNKILDLAKKLHELARRGEGGEKENAADMLERVMKRHGITWDMLEEDLKKERVIYFDIEQKQFLRQVIFSVAGIVDIFVYHSDKRRKKKRFNASLTDSEYIQVVERFEFYWDKYKEDEELFYSAFIQKNRLYVKPDENAEEAEDKPLTPEERSKLFKMSQMMAGMDRHNPIKKLNASKY